jgi:CheY-like chemotaxis protein
MQVTSLPARSHRESLRILVADDNLVNQKILVKLLASLSFTADVVNDGLEVLEAVSAKQYDVILMDIRMPHMDGLEATRRIHADMHPSQQPRWIFALTADMVSSVEGPCKAAGMAGLLCKPVNKLKLQSVLTICAQCVYQDAQQQPSSTLIPGQRVWAGRL